MSPLKVVVTGAKGQLGTELVSILNEENEVEVVGLSREDLDITDPTQVQKKIYELMPDVVIHAAAYTNVDMAEDVPDTAFLVNGIGTKNLAIAASKLKAKFVFISTDYVFNGDSKKPIGESETPCPLGVYGQTKLAGENYVRKYLGKYFIVRTSWVYGVHGKNFVKTMLKLSDKIDQVMVVDDQIGSPTYTFDLAQCILRLISTDKYGIYHVTNSGSCSWHEFALAIFEEANIEMNVVPCKTDEFPRKAPRPHYSVLNNTALRENGFPQMENWRKALTHFFVRFSNENRNQTIYEKGKHPENTCNSQKYPKLPLS
ncbi:dTDP-4-dehydrorhamnose reductase [Bacillus sp. B15-48]|uniref:dTDP-4-dehydrorhamnose reductase n=1 Tax=Bacillus sp. B15-48 TaxID=1548601 RepID=UPI00193FF2F1|nr:dTDP-4-dehydrorhamnose reductase [Bacillus sp. B15-48]MBM4764478.1 dTDP-4-dehydrorhamnose reductase [Bacillus sp. B15-48]